MQLTRGPIFSAGDRTPDPPPSLVPVLEPAHRSLRLSLAPPTVHTRCSFAVRSRTSDLLVYAANVYTYFILVFHHPPHSLVPGLNLTFVEMHPTVASPLQD